MRIAHILLASALALGAATSALADTASPTPAAPAQLTVTFDAIAQQTGAVMLALYNSEASYRGAPPVRAAVIPAGAATVSTVFEGLPPGQYAVKAFHDVNGNGKMDANPFGLPLEPYAFSNNAVGSMGQPGWAAAAFTVDAGTVTHTIRFN